MCDVLAMLMCINFVFDYNVLLQTFLPCTQGSRRSLRSDQVPVSSTGTLDVELDLVFTLQVIVVNVDPMSMVYFLWFLLYLSFLLFINT